MSEPTPPAAPAQPGPFERLVERVRGDVEPDAKRVEEVVLHVAADAASILTDHASLVYSFTGDLLDAIKLIDPADAAALAAFQALVPRAVAMAGKVSDLVGAALKGA